MSLIACGLNHKTAPIVLRERFTSSDTLEVLLKEFRDTLPAKEAVLLYTCNRTELYCVQIDELALLQWLAQRHGVSIADLQAHCYIHNNHEAVRHIMRVASGLDSMVLGEPQILGQLKQAYLTANQVGSVGPELASVFQRAFIAGKKVRSHTELGSHPVSIAYAGVSLAKKIFSNLKNSRVMLIGAGDTMELTARHLHQQGVTQFYFVNRTESRAHYLAEEFSGRALSLSDIPNYIANVDIIFTATASPLPILGKGMVESALKTRHHQPMLIVDLAVPRDVETEVGNLPDVFLYNIDDLQHIIEDNLGKREIAAVKAEQVISAELDAYIKWHRSLRAVSTIRQYREKMEAFRISELQRAQNALLQGEDPKIVLEQLSHRLAHKLAHAPTTQLRKLGVNGRDDLLELADIFLLDS